MRTERQVTRVAAPVLLAVVAFLVPSAAPPAAQGKTAASAGAGPGTEQVLLGLAKTYLEARTYHLLSSRTGDPVPGPTLPATALSPAMAARAARVDASLDRDRARLKASGQRWLSTSVAVTPVRWTRLPDGLRVQLVEKTSLYFDKTVDPEAPDATEQGVERLFTFEQVAGDWRISEMVLTNPHPPLPLNDGPPD